MARLFEYIPYMHVPYVCVRTDAESDLGLFHASERLDESTSVQKCHRITVLVQETSGKRYEISETVRLCAYIDAYRCGMMILLSKQAKKHKSLLESDQALQRKLMNISKLGNANCTKKSCKIQLPQL